MSWRDEAKRRCEAATEGPWEAHYYHAIPDDGHAIQTDRALAPMVVQKVYWTDGDGNARFRWVSVPHGECDSDFIAAARTDLPRALAALDERDALLARCVDELRRTVRRKATVGRPERDRVECLLREIEGVKDA